MSMLYPLKLASTEKEVVQWAALCIGRLSVARYAGALGALVAGGQPPDEAAAIASAVGAAFCRAEGWPSAAETVWVAARAAEIMPAKSAGSC